MMKKIEVPGGTTTVEDDSVFTYDEWMALGWLLFKTVKREEWKFQCPSCGGVQSGIDFEVRGQKAGNAYSQCLKRDAAIRRGQRDLKEGECDRCAWGLFRGPNFVIIPEVDDEPKTEAERTIPVFAFHGVTHQLVRGAKRHWRLIKSIARARSVI